MSRTAAQLIDEVHGLLQSFSLDESQSTTLAADVTSGALTLTVTDTRGVAVGVSPGVIEIGQELLYVATVDASGTATVPPWGRGYLGTTAAAHTAGSRVISQPTFPRAWTLQAINETLDRVFPEVFAVKSTELTTTFPVLTYTLPSDAEWVLKAAWQTPSAAQYWQAVKRFRMSAGGGSLFGDTGKSVDVADGIVPGRPIQFLYAASPTHLAAETDVFETVTGLGSGLIDVVALGAASSLMVSQEASRLQLSSVEQQNRSGLVAPSAALTTSNLMDKRFQTRLLEERKSLQRLYPPRITGAWQ